jgi:hypothetical protein
MRYPPAIYVANGNFTHLSYTQPPPHEGLVIPIPTVHSSEKYRKLSYLLYSIEGGQSKQKQKLLPLVELPKGTPYSATYLKVLANRRVIDAVKGEDEKTWMIARKIIDDYVAD